MSDRFSYSKTSTYEQCPFKFYLQYVLGNYAYSDSIATEFGTAVHQAEEAIALAIRDGRQINYPSIKNTFILKNIALQKKYTKEYFAPDNKSGQTYLQKMYKFLNGSIYDLEHFMQEHQEYEITGIEEKFDFTYDDRHSFNGAIDRILHNTADDSYIVQDIKTWAVPKAEDELKTPLQFVVYVLALQHKLGTKNIKVKCQYDLPICEIKQDAGTANFIDRGIKKINKLFAEIDQQIFDPNPSCLCNYCSFCQTNPDASEEFKHLCPYYSLWNRTTRNKFEIKQTEFVWEGLEKHAEVMAKYKARFNL